MAREDCITRHTVMIHDRGGVRRLAQLKDVSELTWIRELDAIAGATITVAGRYCAQQADVLNTIAARRHEVVIFRGIFRVWEGPIAQVAWYRDRVVLTCRDVVEYVNGTPLTQDYPFDTGTPVGESSALMTDRIETILLHELTVPYDMETNAGTVTVPRWETLDPPANILDSLEVRPSPTLLTRSNTVAFQMTVGEHLDTLAEGGLNYTTIGRKLLIWDGAYQLGRTRILTEADFFGDVEVYASGPDFAAIAHLSAQRDPDEDDDSPSVGNAGASDPYYGPWTSILSLTTEEGNDTPVQSELNSQAGRYLVGRNPVPIQLRVPQGAGIILSHDLTINQLVAGVVMPVRAVLNLRPVMQDQILTKLTVTETAEGETIHVDLVPSGELLVAA